MKKITACISLIVGLSILSALLSGCATPCRPAHDYLQRPVRVAIVPGVNKTDQPEANVVVDKAWETAITKLGYKNVVSADRVVTYAAASGVSLEQVGKTDTAKLGQDLKVDAILNTQILTWETSYLVLAAGSTVAGVSSLVDASTGATIWEYHWILVDQSSNNSGGGIVGMMVSAAITATINAASDAPTRLAKQAIEIAASTVPLPENAPNAPEAKVPL